MKRGGVKLKAVLVVLVVAGAYAAYRGYELVSFRQALRAAEAAIERRDFKTAGTHLEKCLTLQPQDPALRLLAARTARRRSDFETARRELKTFAQLNGSEAERRLELQLIDIQVGIDRAATDRLLESCLADPRKPETDLILEVVIADEVKNLELAYNSGMTLVEGPAGALREKTEKAIALWMEHRPGSADRAQGSYWRGRIRALLSPQAALEDYRAALAADPDHFDARLHLAAALGETDPREAAEHLERLRLREPNHEPVRLLLAYTRRSLGQLTEAQRLLDEILAANPKHPAALVERGKTALDAGRFEESAEFLQRALAVAPNEPFIHLALSRALHLAGREAEAKVHQQRYSEIESERLRSERLRSDEERAAWRKRLEMELIRKETAPKNP